MRSGAIELLMRHQLVDRANTKGGDVPSALPRHPVCWSHGIDAVQILLEGISPCHASLHFSSLPHLRLQSRRMGPTQRPLAPACGRSPLNRISCCGRMAATSSVYPAPTAVPIRTATRCFPVSLDGVCLTGEVCWGIPYSINERVRSAEVLIV